MEQQYDKLENKSKTKIFARCAVASIGGFNYGYVLSEMSILFYYLIYKLGKDPTNYNQTILVAIMSCGACFISWFTNYLMNKFGRRLYMMISDIILVIGAVIGIVKNFYVFCLARFIMGVAVGMNSNVVSMYIREMSPDSISGTTGSFFQYQINLGIILGIAMSLPFGSQYNQVYCSKEENFHSCQDISYDYPWRLVILTPCIFACARFFLLKFLYKLDTPYYYYSVGRFEEGNTILNEIYSENDAKIVSKSIKASLPKNSNENNNKNVERKNDSNDSRLDKQIQEDKHQQIDIKKEKSNNIEERLINQDNKQKEKEGDYDQQNFQDMVNDSSVNFDQVSNQCFLDGKDQYPLENLDLSSNSQLNYYQMNEDVDLEESFKEKAKQLRKKSQRRRFLIGIVMNFFQQLTGINFVIQYSANLLSGISNVCSNDMQEIDVLKEDKTISKIILLSYVYLLLAALAGSTLSKQFGRKKYLVGGYFICGCIHVVFAVMNGLSKFGDKQKNDNGDCNIDDKFIYQIIIVIVVFLFYGTFNCSIGPVTWIFTSDILKEKHISFSVAFNWLGIVVSSAINFNGETTYNFIVFSACCFIGSFIAYVRILETQGKSYYEIIKLYSQ